jgi:hypothetical protein
MYSQDHPPPHFHARHGGDSAVLGIAAGELLAGKLPRPQLRLVREWLMEHRREIQENWLLVQDQEPSNQIDPLK